MEANNIITFEIGDIAYDPYYNYTGIVKEFKTVNGIDYIILHNPTKPIEHTCSSTLKKESLNDLMPTYLRLICKKDDYEKIAQVKIFGHGFKLNEK